MIFHWHPGNDTLVGITLPGNISGMGGNDALSGLEGDDLIDGGDGIDTLDGGAGNDTLNGGADADRFSFGSFGTLGADMILDFAAGLDHRLGMRGDR